MAETLPPEQEASYSAIIDDILASSDLETVSAKRIRKGLQEKVDYDISPQKQAITDLIMSRFDKIQREQESSNTAAPEPAPTTNGALNHTERTDGTSEPTSPTKRKASSSEDRSDVADSPPPRKKVKKYTKPTETDEQIAKRMQAELNAPSARSTRRGGSGKKKKKGVVKKKMDPTPKKSKAKSKSKIKSEDDSDVDSNSDDESKPVKQRTGGFHKPYTLSTPLSEMLGEVQLSRPQTVKKIWAYVKERELQDPNDKRQIRCDEAMRAVFKQERVHMFTMNKLLADHLYAADE